MTFQENFLKKHEMVGAHAKIASHFDDFDDLVELSSVDTAFRDAIMGYKDNQTGEKFGMPDSWEGVCRWEVDTTALSKDQLEFLEKQRLKVYLFFLHHKDLPVKDQVLGQFKTPPLVSHRNPLQWAVDHPSRQRFLKELSEVKELVTSKDQLGNNLLHLAVCAKNLPAVECLIDQFDANEPNYQGDTPLSILFFSTAEPHIKDSATPLENRIYALLINAKAQHIFYIGPTQVPFDITPHVETGGVVMGIITCATLGFCKLILGLNKQDGDQSILARHSTLLWGDSLLLLYGLEAYRMRYKEGHHPFHSAYLSHQPTHKKIFDLVVKTVIISSCVTSVISGLQSAKILCTQQAH